MDPRNPCECENDRELGEITTRLGLFELTLTKHIENDRDDRRLLYDEIKALRGDVLTAKGGLKTGLVILAGIAGISGLALGAWELIKGG